ncbi:MAG: type II/IV secretion system ATPase subunit [Nanoarchaeota archaeon]
MFFNENSPLYATEVQRKQGEEILYVNFLKASFVPSLADSPDVMARVVDLLSENPSISRIVFVQQRNYNYSFEQTSLLQEIARVHQYFIKQENILSPIKLTFFGNVQEVYSELTYLLLLLRQDPLLCFTKLKRRIGALRAQLQSVEGDSSLRNYFLFLERFASMLETTRLLILWNQQGSPVLGREFYTSVFRADVLPNFTFTRLVAQFPDGAKLVDQYILALDDEEIPVTLLKHQNEAKHFYHVLPPEYTLSEEHHALLHLARNVLVEHRPKTEELTDVEKTRQVFFNISRDLLSELAQSKKISLSHRELIKLARILVRHTIGFGLIEILLLDSKLQDIVLNAPIAQTPIYVRHETYGECVSNIIPSYEDADSWAAKLRLQSGRPLDEANPVLDTDLVFGKARARVAAIKEPLSPNGLAYAFRRHRDNPWTLPLFMERGMLNAFAAGLLSFIVDGNRTILVAGTRSSGKTSLLGSLMLEILPNVRTIVIEDTLELPVDSLRQLGYDILRMKVRSALTSGTTEVEASEGIRASLRLGDSALIVGEVRSSEARALYEAMRVGALANVVAGTLHGDSPYGVFDRVVHDLGVPETSFKATDIIIIANPVRTPDGLHAERRIVQITEVRKHWLKDPLAERGFVDLLKYNVEKDQLEPTPELINGDSEILKSIAAGVKGWAGNWEAVYDNILLRAKIKQELLNFSHHLQKPELLEASFVVLAQTAFHSLSEKVTREYGLPLSGRVFLLWKQWLSEAIRVL